jgi:hypothetical protein
MSAREIVNYTDKTHSTFVEFPCVRGSFCLFIVID